METRNYQYNGVTVTVEDNKAAWDENKQVTGIIAQYSPEKQLVSLIIPAPKKRDTTKNPPLIRGEKTGMEVTVRKDGTYGFSWTPKAGELRLIPLNTVVREFRECMIRYYEQLGL